MAGPMPLPPPHLAPPLVPGAAPPMLAPHFQVRTERFAKPCLHPLLLPTTTLHHRPFAYAQHAKPSTRHGTLHHQPLLLTS